MKWNPLLIPALPSLALVVLTTSACVVAVDSEPGFITAEDVPSVMAALTPQGIRQGVEVLARDELGGRGTGTEGERQAAQWIADQFQEIGLKPLGDNYFQEVELVGYRKKAQASSLVLNGPAGEIPYENEKTLTYWSTAQKPQIDLSQVPLVFVGYGVEAPEVGWDDYKGYDTAGKVLVFLNNDPPVEEAGQALFGGEARTYYGRWTYKFEQAMARGALGALMIHTDPSAGYGWQVIQNVGLNEGFALDLPNSGYQLDFLAWIHQDLANDLAATVGADLDGWFEAAKSRDFTPLELPIRLDAHLEVEIRHSASQNVVGVLEGADPKLKDELIVFTAHYDHLGRLETEGEGDLVYNGAWDNASGTAGIIEIARALAKSEIPPSRSIAFLACAAEEKGSLGSRWFVSRPPVPLERIVANLNVDMPQIFGLSTDVAAIGKATNSLGDTLVRVATDFGVEGPDGQRRPVEVTGDPNPNAGSFYRSDQVNFAKAGIPALFINPGKKYVRQLTVDPAEYRDQHYHQLSDEINDAWDLAGCARDMKLLALTALNVANNPELPRWRPGNEFEGKWMEMHPEE